MGMKKLLLVTVLVAGGLWQYDQNRVIEQADGVIAAAEPLQHNVNNAPAFRHADYTVTPLANFAVEARVLSRKKYTLGREAALSPLDLALGWGPMSDNQVLDKIDISQGNRFYYWRAEQEPIPHREIIRHSSNMHMIPADERVAEQLAGIREGNLIALTGQLVKIKADDGWRWQSSLSRTDTGNGACELVWVKAVSVL